MLEGQTSHSCWVVDKQWHRRLSRVRGRRPPYLIKVSITFPGLQACLDHNHLHGIPQTSLSVLETLTSDPQAYQWPVFEVRGETHQQLHSPQAFWLQCVCVCVNMGFMALRYCSCVIKAKIKRYTTIT